jgi:hypothetical protein
MSFEVLSFEGGSGSRWEALVRALPPELRDIHFLPEYGQIYRDTYGHEPHLAVYREANDFVLQPFIRRSLRQLPFLASVPDAARYADIANAYGYGGPLCGASNQAEARRLYEAFADEFSAWCDAESIASEFASLHPFLIDRQRPLIDGVLAIRYEKDVVYIDLEQSEADLVRSLSRGTRSNISKAQRAGVRVEKADLTPENLDLFNKIYHATMRRKAAAPRWHFPESYFVNCVRRLGPKRCSLFFAVIGDAVESAYFLMHDFNVAYYHFGGSLGTHAALRPNNLLMYETALWAKREGYTRYHLGGGVTRQSDDPLLRFKAGFSSHRAPLYTYFCIRDPIVYDELCSRKRAFEIAATGAESPSDFLPLYRR